MSEEKERIEFSGPQFGFTKEDLALAFISGRNIPKQKGKNQGTLFNEWYSEFIKEREA
jgi:hypothetical protein